MDSEQQQQRPGHEVLPQVQPQGSTAGEGPNDEIKTLPSLPDIPTSTDLNDLELAISSVAGVAPTEEETKLHKRASSVLKLSQENEKLRAELKAMTERLEAAERRKTELRERASRNREQHNMEPPSS